MSPCGLCSGDIHPILELRDLQLYLCDRCKKIWMKKSGIMFDRTIYFEEFEKASNIMKTDSGKRG